MSVPCSLRIELCTPSRLEREVDREGGRDPPLGVMGSEVGGGSGE